MNPSLYERIYSIVKAVPEGRVCTYGDIALILGDRRLSRAVGYALFSCRDPEVPCHRVVDRNGRLAPAFTEQGCLLEKEGIPVINGHIELEKYRYRELFLLV